VAADFCVSEQTVRKWVRRWRAGGEIALQDRSSTPARLRRLAPDRVAQIEGLRRQRMNSPAIARRLSMPISTVTSTLRRLGLNRLKALDPPAPAIRYHASDSIQISYNVYGHLFPSLESSTPAGKGDFSDAWVFSEFEHAMIAPGSPRRARKAPAR
jgi:hypothetical protein